MKVAITLALLLAPFLMGCTAVAVRKPMNLSGDNELSSSLIGEWLGSNDETITISRNLDSPELIARYSEDGQPKSIRFLAVKIEPDCFVIWADAEVDGFAYPARLIKGEDAVVLLLPDLDQMKAYVTDGSLQIAIEEVDGHYLIEYDGLERLLATKEFWSLRYATPFLRKDDIED